MTYSELVASGANTRELREWLVAGENHSTTIRISDNMRDAIMEVAGPEGFTLSTFVRRALLDELAGKWE